MATAIIADDIHGDKLYQARARLALPILVRQAHASQTITYENLAAELDMPNARNLNYVLGSIGRTLELHSTPTDRIPLLQCLVVNSDTGLPGEGFDSFIKERGNLSKLSQKKKMEAVQAELQDIFLYEHWHTVLNNLGLSALDKDYSSHLNAASIGGGIGEGIEHLNLKKFVASHPGLVGLPQLSRPGLIEFKLPSGDSLDVCFVRRSKMVGVEVKSHRSNDADITRGLFQCIKYQAVLEAYQLSKNKPQNVRTILVLGGAMPSKLRPLANILGVKIIDEVDKIKNKAASI